MKGFLEFLEIYGFITDWIQLIFTGFGIWLASRYMRQHAKKVRLEKSYSLIHSCILKIARYVSNSHLFYKQVTAPKLKYLLKEITAVQAVAEIEKDFKEKYRDLNENTISLFEIDAEIKLISNDRIKVLFDSLFECISAVGSQLESISSIKKDEENCKNFLMNIPYGLFGNEHYLNTNFSKTYRLLMSSLLAFYIKQEEELDSIPNLNLFNVFKKRV